MFCKELGRRVSGTGITTYAVHPGQCNTSMATSVYDSVKDFPGKDLINDTWLKFFSMSAAQGSQTSLFCCLEDSIAEHSGRYYMNCSERKSGVHANNAEHARELWNIGAEVTGCPQDLASS